MRLLPQRLRKLVLLLIFYGFSLLAVGMLIVRGPEQTMQVRIAKPNDSVVIAGQKDAFIGEYWFVASDDYLVKDISVRVYAFEEADDLPGLGGVIGKCRLSWVERLLSGNPRVASTLDADNDLDFFEVNALIPKKSPARIRVYCDINSVGPLVGSRNRFGLFVNRMGFERLNRVWWNRELQIEFPKPPMQFRIQSQIQPVQFEHPAEDEAPISRTPVPKGKFPIGQFAVAAVRFKAYDVPPFTVKKLRFENCTRYSKPVCTPGPLPNIPFSLLYHEGTNAYGMANAVVGKTDLTFQINLHAARGSYATAYVVIPTAYEGDESDIGSVPLNLALDIRSESHAFEAVFDTVGTSTAGPGYLIDKTDRSYLFSDDVPIVRIP